MKDSQKPCQHTLSDDAVYKEVVVIGNGPSGMVTSFMLAGNVPYLKKIPADLPIDDMLRARLENLPPGQSLYEADLTELAEGLEGRSQNPIPLLMDNLLRPCADLGVQADSLIEWKYDVEKQIEHIVLGRGPPGGAWHTFPPAVRTLSPAAWLALPPHAAAGERRLPARAVADYCRRYVHKCNLQRYFRCGVVVTGVRAAPRAPPACAPRACAPRACAPRACAPRACAPRACAPRACAPRACAPRACAPRACAPRACAPRACPRAARFLVHGYDKSSGRSFRVLCRRVVVACGGGDRPSTLSADVTPHALHSLGELQRALPTVDREAPTVLIVGSGLSAADGVALARRAGLPAAQLHRRAAAALARLHPRLYPDYCEVYKMMCDGAAGQHTNYTSYPHHVIAAVSARGAHKVVTLLDLRTNETTQLAVSLIGVFIGSKPDLFFLQTFNLDCIETDCRVQSNETKHTAKRKIEDERCFLKNHWHYLKSVVGQSIRSCKTKYLNYTEVNENDTTCIVPDCNKPKCKCEVIEPEGKDKCHCQPSEDKCQCEPSEDKDKCQCQPSNPYSNGIGFGIDPEKPVDCSGNPVAIDKGTHEMLYAPKGMYALGPLTADNFIRFIPGGALALVAHIHKEHKAE